MSLEKSGVETSGDIKEKAAEYLALFDNELAPAVRLLGEVQTNRQASASGKKTMPRTPVVVEIKDVSKAYKLGSQKVQALKEVNLRIHEGEFVALTGPSGSGKSTLLQMIGGLDRPSSGEVVVNNQDIAKLSDRKLSVFRNQTIGFVFQFFYLQPFLNTHTNLQVPAMFARTKRQERQGKAVELAEAVGLGDRLKHLPKELSGGQMQRAAIARALMNNPKLILADEPTGNLDRENGIAIIELFDEVRRRFGTTVIIVTHDRDIAARADREIAVKDGRVTI